MSKYMRYIAIAVSMLLGLYLYFMYRSQTTLINILLAKMGIRQIPAIMEIWNAHYLIPKWGMYSLPEGLWVFAATLQSHRLYFFISNRKFYLKYIPLAFALLVEALQLVHITDGKFDFTDIVLSSIFGLLGIILPISQGYTHIKNSRETYLVILIYILVILSDVWVYV